MLKKIRKKIDKIDKKIMHLLDARFLLSKNASNYKQTILDKEREAKILKNAENFRYNKEIGDVYLSVLDNGKSVQTPKSALIGKGISYSLSKEVYERFFNFSNYLLIDTKFFYKNYDKYYFDFLNVTSPFKEKIYQKIKNHSKLSQLTQSGNLVINNTLYNTDIAVIKDQLKNFTEDAILVIGTGAIAKGIKRVFTNAVVIPSYPKKARRALLKRDLTQFAVLINASHYGKNHEPKFLFDLSLFKNLKLIYELNYYPINSHLVKYSFRNYLSCVDGLDHLLLQATKNMELFRSEKLSFDIKKAKRYFLKTNLNIILIGMPYSGKSYLGKLVSEKLNKTFIDTDSILQNENHFLDKVGEETFRKYEDLILRRLENTKNTVISLGGGACFNSAFSSFKTIGLVVFLDTDLDVLLERFDDSRPLIKSKEVLEKLFYERRARYIEKSDITIKNEEIEKLEEKIYAYFNC